MSLTWLSGPWSAYVSSALDLLGLIVWALIATQRMRRLDASEQLIERGLWLIALAAGAGAILVPAVPGLRDLVVSGTLRRVQGSSFPGALLGGIGAAALWCHLHKLPMGQYFDLIGWPIPLSQAIGRLGCFGAGCCYGRATSSWLGVYLPDIRGEWAVRCPTQLMSAAINLLTFLGLWALERYVHREADTGGRPWWFFDGLLFLLYVNLYCSKRLAMDFLRGDAALIVGPISWVRILCASGIVAATTLIISNIRCRSTARVFS